jgi:hypothetical protein
MGAVAQLGPAARVRRRREGWPRRGTRGSGFSPGAIGTIWRTQPWPSRWRSGTREHRPRRDVLTAALDCSGEQLREQQSGAGQIKGGRRVAHLEGKRWSREATAEEQRLDGATMADSGCARKRSGECGPDATGRERAHRRVSRAADSKAKLTVALDGARAQRRPRNRRWTSAGGGGAPCLRGQSERKGERARQRAQMREGTWASRARWLGRGRRTRGRGRVHGRGSWARG